MELLPVLRCCQKSLLPHCVDVLPVVSEGPSLSPVCDGVTVRLAVISVNEQVSEVID